MTRRISSKQLILQYFREHVGKWIHNQTLREISKQNDVPRTIRSLRQEGWNIETRGDGYNRLASLEKGPERGRRESISQRVRYEVLHRDNFRCRACGRGTDEGAVLVVDHAIPVDWGGTNEPENLQAFCRDCNQGKQAWLAGLPGEQLKSIMALTTVEARIEALFDAFPNKEIPSSMVQLVSRGAFDWQRALRRVRQNTGKDLRPTSGRRGYVYHRR